MLTDHWPLYGLRLTTPRLELRLPGPEELAALGDLAGRGLHEPGQMPFIVPWTELPPAERARSVLQHFWRRLGSWEPSNWELQLAVFLDGVPVGVQDIGAADFAVLRETSTGSWLGREYQGQGIGTEMRAAVLELAFTGLGAVASVSAAFTDNPSSLAVSTKNGYEPDGLQRYAVGTRAVTSQRLRLTRERWRHRDLRVPVKIDGLAPCLRLMDADPR